jgi:putative toxin-antitoxin system antitoxin component (TIGR02293 family)
MKATTFEEIYQTSGLEAINKLKAGVPANSFPKLASILKIPTTKLASALGINKRTLQNRTQYLNTSESERSYRAYRIYRRACEVLNDEAAAKAWINAPQPALGDKRPIELLTLDIGVDTVINILNGIEDGGYL